ncbi:YdcF family protein [Yoonia sp. 208BN28-4]|uniref:YdcF family protein n=1 Tax=Yoonia sp. 208BN28-4 TaxID=3126505 RepID=UPI0030ACA51F
MKAIIVLGAAVWVEGPSPTLLRRSVHAASVWHGGGHDLIVACGGLGRFPPSEAAAIMTILRANDVPPTKILQEDQSTTTLENLIFARQILRSYDCAEITIVTDGYHGPRAKLVARTLGLRASVSSPGLKGSHLPTQARQYVRETFAYPAYAARLAARRIKGPLD